MNILLVGGGTGGPVAPLLAVAGEIQRDHERARFLLVGTHSGPERHMAESARIPFMAIRAGKLRRYFSLSNILSPFLIIAGFFQSIGIMRSFKPDVVFGTGSFVQVPVMWAAWFMRVPVVLHQQDLYPSLANKLCEFVAKKITVSFEDSLTDFGSGWGLFYKKDHDRVVLTGNPFRHYLADFSRADGVKQFGLDDTMPTILVFGGGTGASFINTMVSEALPELVKSVQIIHATGAGKFKAEPQKNYHPYEFITDMGPAYAAADIVVSRAGLSAITELSNLGKMSIIIPMPNSHQEVNALLLAKYQAAIVVPQSNIDGHGLLLLIRKLLMNREAQQVTQKNISEIMPKRSAKKIADILIKIITTTHG